MRSRNERSGHDRRAKPYVVGAIILLVAWLVVTGVVSL